MSATSPSPRKQQIINNGARREQVSGSGHGLFATRHFAPRSQILFVQRPSILALESSYLDSTCYSCLRSQNVQVTYEGSEPQDIDLKNCTGCRTVRFCNRACQKSAWTAYHKHECKIFAELQPRVLPSTVRGVIRLLLQRKHGLLPDEERDGFFTLQSHQDDLRAAGGDRWQDICLMSKAIQAYSGTSESIETILRICCIMMVNSFTLTTPTFDPIGIALHHLPALMNHSCAPNAFVRFDITSSHSPNPPPKVHHGSISVHALEPISAGDEIRTTYIDTTASRPRRQADLLSRYFFTCTCPACGHDAQLTTTSSLIPDESHPAVARALRLIHASPTSTKTNPTPSPSQIPTLKRALTALSSSSTSPLQTYPSPQLRHQLILALIASASASASTPTPSPLKLALDQNLLLTTRIDPSLYPRPHHPSRLVSKWRLLRLVNFCLDNERNQSLGSEAGRELRMLAMVCCWLLGGLVRDVGLGDVVGTGEGGREREGGDDGRTKGEGKEGMKGTPLGQFELMVYQAFVDFTAGEGQVVWRDYVKRKDHWDREVERWVNGIVEELLLREERVGGGEVEGGTGKEVGVQS